MYVGKTKLIKQIAGLTGIGRGREAVVKALSCQQPRPLVIPMCNVMQGQGVRVPADPFVVARGVHAAVGAGPAELQQVARVAAAEVRHDKGNGGKSLGYRFQAQGADVHSRGQPAPAAQDPEMDQYRQVEPFGHIPQGSERRIGQRFLHQGGEQFAPFQTQAGDRFFQQRGGAIRFRGVVSEAGESLLERGQCFRQGIVAAAGVNWTLAPGNRYFTANSTAAEEKEL